MMGFNQTVPGQSLIENNFLEFGVNLDHEAARVLTSAAQTVRAILDRRAKLDQAGQYDVPLIVSAGEYHAFPAYMIRDMAVLKEISRYEKTVVCTESPHSFMEDMFEQFQKHSPSKKVRAALKGMDMAGILSLESCIGFTHMAGSPFANKVLQKFILDQRIPARFADVAHDGFVLDFNDVSTCASIRHCFNALTDMSGIDVESRMGMKIRNHHMAKQTMAHIRNHDARIAFVKCGTDHAEGDVGGGYPEKESLSCMSKGEGAAVLGMPVVQKNMRVPLRRELTDEEIFPIEALSNVVTHYNAWTDGRLDDRCNGIPLQSAVEEAAYVNGVLERIGLQDHVLSVAQHAELMVLKQQKMLQVFKACDRVPSLVF